MIDDSYEHAEARAEAFLTRVGERYPDQLSLKKRELGFVLLEHAVTENRPSDPDFVNAVGEWLKNPALPRPELSGLPELNGTVVFNSPPIAATIVGYLITHGDFASAMVLTAVVSMRVVTTLPGAAALGPDVIQRGYDVVWDRCESWLRRAIDNQAAFETCFLPGEPEWGTASVVTILDPDHEYN